MHSNKLAQRTKLRPTSPAACRLDLASSCVSGTGVHAGIASRDIAHPDIASVVGRLAQILAGPLGGFAVQGLRVRPRQLRSIESVERILSTAAKMTFGQKRAKNISIERISSEAGVTPQATYRYFKDAEDLVKTVLRCIAIVEHERTIKATSNRTLVKEEDLAKLIVGSMIETCRMLERYPTHIRVDILQEYRHIGYDASMPIVELICLDVDPMDIRRSLDLTKAAVALTATIAVATSFFAKNIAPLRDDRFEGLLADLFVHVLQSGGSSSGEFHEMETELDVYLSKATS